MVDVDVGAIEVLTHASDQIEVSVHRKVSLRTPEREREFLSDRPVTFSREGGTLTIRARRESGPSGWSWSFGGRSIDAKFQITVPVGFAATLNTRGGPIEVRGLHGNLRAETSGGGLRFEGIQGDLHGTTSGGGVQLKNCQGTLRVDTSGGGIRSEGGGGKLKANTSGGSIEVLQFAGPASLNTSGGGIRVAGIGGEIQGETSGGSIHAQIPSPVPGPIRLGTSGGGIELLVPNSAAFDLDAETSAGRVSCELPIVLSGKPNRGSMHGPVNGGGPQVHLRTSAGGVRIRSAESAIR